MATDLPFRHKNLPTFQFYRMDLPLDKRPVRFCQNLTKRVRRQFASRMGVSIDFGISVKMVVHRENAADWLNTTIGIGSFISCLLYTSPSPRDQRGSRMPSSA